MKFIYKSFAIALLLVLSVSCVKEAMIEVNPAFILSYERDGKTDALAGTAFYVIPTGSGEFITLFDGAPGRVWGEPGAKGIDLERADSLSVQYNAVGKYQLTLVATSAGDFGKEVSRKVKTVEVNVVDERNGITLFNINGVDGLISANNEITFSVPDITTNFNFPAIFVLQSDSAKVYVNNVKQTSGVTINDFTNAVVYKVVSVQGNEQLYTVKFSTFPSSSEKAITNFVLGLGGNGEVAVIDEDAKTISINANYATNLTAVRLVLGFSYASKVYLSNVAYSDRKNYNISPAGITSIKVVAQNNSEVNYTIIITTQDPVSTFTFTGLVPAPVGIINKAAKTISVDVLSGTDVTKLTALWTGSTGKVTIGTVAQTNGVSVNNFTSPLTYTFYKGTTAGDKYVVTVNIK